jgi:ATP-dependent Clp protease ATP-binding subunit ClpC
LLKEIPVTEGPVTPVFSEDVIQIVKKSVLTAYELEHPYIGTQHLLFTLAKQGIISDFLKDKKAANKVLELAQATLKGTSKLSDMLDAFTETLDSDKEIDLIGSVQLPPETMLPGLEPASYKLEDFALDLTAKNTESKLDPVIGREAEVTRLVEILARRTKNNPLLLGEAGVGKTAIVEGLAKKIAQEQVPDRLIGKRIMSLDIASLMAGTMYRGEFEARLRKILDEIKADPDTILFIDELHNIVGTGGNSGAMDIANILKPALARGEIRCIGATTDDEYKQFIEKDPALDRRFQVIRVKEPSVAQTVEILNGVKSNYERHHNVHVTPEALHAAAQLSERYITDQYLPDKAFDLLDEACAKVSLQTNTKAYKKQQKSLERELYQIREAIHEHLIKEKYQQAIESQMIENDLTSKLLQLQEASEFDATLPTGIVEYKHIIEVLSQKKHIPMNHLMATDVKRYDMAGKILKTRIIGQDHAIDSVISSLKRHTILPKKDKTSPMGVYLFAGPSGVGKTELAKQLAQEVFVNKESFIRVDMSEFSESFASSKLIGAPAGYVGYRETNMFTDKVRKHPYSLILLDEVEKAHPNLFNLLLQIFDEGRITDSTGREIDFSNTIIVMTSNIGAEFFAQAARAIGFGQESESKQKQQFLDEKLEKIFRPEFLNRIDEVIAFNALQQKDFEHIVKLKLNDLLERLEQQGYNANYTNKAVENIAQEAKKAKKGTRHIERMINDLVEEQIIDIMLADHEEKNVSIRSKNNKIIIKHG